MSVVFELNDRVQIIGGSLLPDYQVSLNGIEGNVVSSRHDAPPGTVAVWVDWKISTYAEFADDLPTTVNVPPRFLKKVEPPRPQLKMV